MAAKSILVTGANRGIGRRLVERLLCESPEFTVIFTCRDPSAGAQAVREISALGSFASRLLYHPLDILSAPSIDALKNYVETTVGGLDVLVNNAGIAYKGSEFNEQVVRTTLGTNFFATVNVTEALIPVMKPGGHIVMVSSRAGMLSQIPGQEIRDRLLSSTMSLADVTSLAEDFIQSTIAGTVEQRGWPRNSYKVSKNLLNAYIRTKAKELSGRLRINGLCPGWVRTDMGGPNALLSLDQGTETPLAVIRAQGDSSGMFWADCRTASWE